VNTLYPVIFLPLLTAIVNRLFGSRMGKKASAGLACVSVLAAFCFAAASFIGLAHLDEGARRVIAPVYSFLHFGNFDLRYDLLLDPLSAIMICVVTGVGSLIHIYSTSYMEEESDYETTRFFSYLNFFIFSMLTLVLASNFMMMFIGWELVGVSSYLLIGYYRTKTSAADAGKKAFIVNRVGDLGFITGIFILMSFYQTLDFGQILSHPLTLVTLKDGVIVDNTWATATAFLLFMGAMGKSAQVPLHVWLPDAMEGPTPVSALIHAATMVTAGVFLVARCHAIFELSATAMQTVAWIGAITALFAASIAVVQNDIKRIMAYSTLSQLGYMVMAVGLGAYTAGFFHLFTHAFFKALLFLGCGSVMHALHGELDMTKMGGLRKKLPITHATMVIGALCLAGFPLTSGFFSKDEILFQAFAGPHANKGLWLMGTLASLLTAFYVGRFIFKTFYGPTRLDHHTYDHAHESGPAMATPLVILAVLAIAVGFLGMPKFMSSHQPFEEWLSPVFADVNHSAAVATPPAPTASVLPPSGGAVGVKPTAGGPAPAEESAALPLKLIALYTAIIAWALWLTYGWFAKPNERPTEVATRLSYIHKILWNKYYVDELYDLVFVRGLLAFSSWLLKWVDQGLLDGAVNATGWLSQRGSDFVRVRLANGYARFYASALLLGVCLLLYLALTYGGGATAAAAAVAH
jgi:NADH-quinone oxidoreductase subunit L